MEQNTLLQAARMMYDQVRKKRWHKVVSCLAAVVVFCTTYALILPAITMTEEYICGYAEEHTHDESCFEMQVPLPTLECSFDGSGADIVTSNVRRRDASLPRMWPTHIRPSAM